ncbi:MAG: reverse transcriptase [Desulfamplus sp.]|nr:reverse transcriptase [Desulfamplus sp.]
MKRHNNLYEKIYEIENIKFAHRKARKGKVHYKEVKNFNRYESYYIEELHKMLKEKRYKTSMYEIITKITDGGKERKIYKLPYYPDRVVQHCIMNILEPIWFKTLIRDTYSSIKGRGIHDGLYRLKHKLSQDKINTQYCLKLDIKKFYPSIDHNILKRIIRKKIKCKDTLILIDEIIDSAGGVPIGNYLSQYMGNIYLSELDHYCKENLKIKYYFRYCDDIVILNSNKQNLHNFLKLIKSFCSTKLNLIIKSNYQIFPTFVRGIDFLGYRFFYDCILVRKSIVNNMKRKINKKNKASYYGWLKHANAKNLTDTYINRNEYYEKNIQ